MSQWRSVKAKVLLSSLLRIGWEIKRESPGSHKILRRPNWPDYVFAFHGREEIGPRMLSRVSKKTGLKPENL